MGRIHLTAYDCWLLQDAEERWLVADHRGLPDQGLEYIEKLVHTTIMTGWRFDGCACRMRRAGIRDRFEGFDGHGGNDLRSGRHHMW